MEERITQLEASVLRLAANKLDITDLSTYTNAINSELADLRSSVVNLLDRISNLEQYLISQT